MKLGLVILEVSSNLYHPVIFSKVWLKSDVDLVVTLIFSYYLSPWSFTSIGFGRYGSVLVLLQGR